MYTCSISHCYLRLDEIHHNNVNVGSYVAYIGSCSIVSTTEAELSTFDFVSWLNDFFQRGQMDEQEQSRILDLPLKDFLGLCMAAAENLEASQAPTGAPQWGISKKALLTGQKIKCPQCNSAFLMMTDGQVGCPMCQLQLGDIETMSDLI